MAPEVIFGRGYNMNADVWSIGVIVYIMLGGYPPFYSDNQTELFKLIKKGIYQFHPKYWDHISEDAKDLIRNMLVINPDHRPRSVPPAAAQRYRTQQPPPCACPTAKPLGRRKGKKEAAAAMPLPTAA